eukprot:458129-Amphidinium_carterae.1
MRKKTKSQMRAVHVPHSSSLSCCTLSLVSCFVQVGAWASSPHCRVACHVMEKRYAELVPHC